MKINELFCGFAIKASKAVGSYVAFLAAVIVVLAWAISGPAFHFSDTWQLVINTGTTIVTFLMVFLIQNAQNRDSKAFHLKLDELIRSIQGARNQMVDLEDLSDAELEVLRKEFERLRINAPTEGIAESIDALSDSIGDAKHKSVSSKG